MGETIRAVAAQTKETETARTYDKEKKMKIQDILSLYDRIQKDGLGGFENECDNIVNMGEYINEMAQNGKTIITNRLDEQKFVRVLDIVRAMILSSMVAEGMAGNLVRAELVGDLKIFTDTVTPVMIGMLADEEVI